MRPLLFVNWARVAARFTALMWVVALILAFVVAAHLAGRAAGGTHRVDAVHHALVNTR